ncbi:MAG: hypothetical protein U9Q12_03045 [Patescibacteria group bacterium]|nr:hypothetical protein [Patescibacteria group bacterium]
MKKLLMIIPVFLLAFALTANATNGCCECPCLDPEPCECEEECCPNVDVENYNWADQDARVNVSANTGGNAANWNAGLGKIDTGNIKASAYADQKAGFNTTEIASPGSVWVYNKNWADQYAQVGVSANTGGNVANGNKGLTIEGSLEPGCPPEISVSVAAEGAGKITTGNVNATAAAWQVAGVNMTRVNVDAPSAE